MRSGTAGLPHSGPPCHAGRSDRGATLRIDGIAVIGGTGFIGSRATARLAADHEVAVMHRGKHNPALPAGVKQITGDRDRLVEHAGDFRRFNPDVVLDMIAGR